MARIFPEFFEEIIYTKDLMVESWKMKDSWFMVIELQHP
jgi:hypothetical protein